MAPRPRTQIFIKFALLCAVLLGYFAYLSWKFDLATGGVAAALTWSFFVLCTPIADAGFLLDMPMRLIFGIRMVVSELAVWAIAIAINLATLAVAPGYYETTALTGLLHSILLTPFPYWAVILLSAAGTFLSVRFGDEMMDVVHHRDREFFHSNHFRHELILLAFFAVVLVIYFELVRAVGVEAFTH